MQDAPANTDASALGLERSSEAALHAMVYGAARFQSVDDLMLYNALALHRRQLLRLRTGDDWAEVMQVCPGLCIPSCAYLDSCAVRKFPFRYLGNNSTQYRHDHAQH